MVCTPPTQRRTFQWTFPDRRRAPPGFISSCIRSPYSCSQVVVLKSPPNTCGGYRYRYPADPLCSSAHGAPGLLTNPLSSRIAIVCQHILVSIWRVRDSVLLGGTYTPETCITEAGLAVGNIPEEHIPVIGASPVTFGGSSAVKFPWAGMRTPPPTRPPAAWTGNNPRLYDIKH